jgi:L-fucose isomerase
MEAILCSSFDWDGIRQPYMLATENDSLNAVVMLFGHMLTGAAQVFSDVRTYWSPDAVKKVTGHTLTGDAANGFIHLINSGPSALDGSGQQTITGKPAMKPWWDITKDEVQKCLDNTTSMSRVNIIKGLGPVLQIAEGNTIELPEAVHRILDERTDPTWPTTWFVPRLTGEGAFRDVYSVMANWGANHGAFTYGHIGADLITLAAMLRIPVCMHNVDPEKIFRPSAWSAFGMDAEGSDYRACENYGPLYK